MPYLAERASVTTGILKFFSQRIEMLRKILSKIMMEFKKKKTIYMFENPVILWAFHPPPNLELMGIALSTKISTVFISFQLLP